MQPLVELVPMYERALRGDRRQPRGVQKYIWTIRQVIAHFGGKEATQTDLTERSIQRYKEDLADRELSASTIGNNLSVIRSFCRWSMDEELRTDDPTRRIRWPSKDEPLPRALTSEELELLKRILADPPQTYEDGVWHWQRNRRALLIMLYAGLRLAETAALCWRDVDLGKRQLTVWNGKGGKDRMIPMHTELVAELRNVPPEQRMSKAGVVGKREDGLPLTHKSLAKVFDVWLPRQCVLHNIDLDISAHQLRHTFATCLLDNGADLKSIQELLGHKRLDTTQRYLRLEDRHRRAAIDLLPALM